MARMNTRKAFEAWLKGQQYKAPGRNGSPIWTSGGVIYSYGAPIAKFDDASDRTMILNCQTYSNTTSTQRNGLFTLALLNGMAIVKCESEESFRKFGFR